MNFEKIFKKKISSCKTKKDRDSIFGWYGYEFNIEKNDDL